MTVECYCSQESLKNKSRAKDRMRNKIRLKMMSPAGTSHDRISSYKQRAFPRVSPEAETAKRLFSVGRSVNLSRRKSSDR